MSLIEIRSLPKIVFAHVFQDQSYRKDVYPRKNFIEIAYFAEGAGELHTKDGTIPTKKGDVCCYLRTEAMELVAHGFHSHHTVGAFVEWSATRDKSKGLELPMIIPAESAPAEFYQQIDHLIYMYKQEEKEISMAAAFLELLCGIDRYQRQAYSSRLCGEQRYISKAKKYVHQSLSQSISSRQVAKYLEISQGYLCYLFKKNEGISLSSYINRKKLKAIRSLMEYENVKLYEASAAYGFSDSNYVSRLFKQYYGYNITEQLKVYDKKKFRDG